MIFYTLLIIFTILMILEMYYKHKKKRKKVEKELQDSIDNLRNAWEKFIGLF